MMTRIRAFAAVSVVGYLSLSLPLSTASAQSDHTTDGIFTTPMEWDTSRSTVSMVSFPVVGSAGGANLFVEQTGGTLYLMYDFFNSNSMNMTPANSFFDVFFQVASEKEDYVIRFDRNMFNVFEKPTDGPPSRLNSDGTFDLSPPIWTPLNAADLDRAQFQTAIGFGHDPASSTVPDHLLAEFQLAILTKDGHGFYDPAPAFWSASADRIGALDPPISSAIFTLNPNGTTTVTPVLGPDGQPGKQPRDFVPEPASIVLSSLGGAALLAYSRRRKQPTATK